ncbi:hypothetical protein J132_05269 [Termitomyces sp. J132]|nr:hypothetical protein H2248_008114 [Termitomyces sp. 'cryptogamus']KNZ77521.1 hypothetical protein J132_05269 [Termitomyces sp. J132]
MVLQNPEINDLWHFAAQFWEDFYKKDCEMVFGEAAWAGKLITAKCIYSALEIKSSAVHQAIEGDHLVQHYTGINEDFSLEVAEEIGTRWKQPLG